MELLVSFWADSNSHSAVECVFAWLGTSSHVEFRTLSTIWCQKAKCLANCKQFWRQWSCPNLRWSTGICLEELRETMKTHRAVNCRSRETLEPYSVSTASTLRFSTTQRSSAWSVPRSGNAGCCYSSESDLGRLSTASSPTVGPVCLLKSLICINTTLLRSSVLKTSTAFIKSDLYSRMNVQFNV